MNVFLAILCIAALSACSDDETAEQKPAVIGNVQFAAVSTVSAESRPFSRVPSPAGKPATGSASRR